MSRLDPIVYLDNNATTRMDPEVRVAMEPFLDVCYGNPSSPYGFARPASRALALAREQVAALAGVEPARVVFTSGGTESNNLALRAALAARPERRHLIVSAVEHASVLETAYALARQGIRLTVLPVSPEGTLEVDTLERALTPDTALVSLMGANNETGVCFPLADLIERVRACGAYFHVDAVQLAGKQQVEATPFDFVSLCAHKVHGPKGVGALVVPAHLEAHPMMTGGNQEFGWRAGTENVAACAGFGAAAALAAAHREVVMPRLQQWRDQLEAAVLAKVPDSRVIGAGQPRLPNTSLFLFGRVQTEALLARLDLEGFCCSSGSACMAGAQEPSHILRAMGWAKEGAALRVSTSRFTRESDVESLVPCLIKGINTLRQMA